MFDLLKKIFSKRKLATVGEIDREGSIVDARYIFCHELNSFVFEFRNPTLLALLDRDTVLLTQLLIVEDHIADDKRREKFRLEIVSALSVLNFALKKIRAIKEYVEPYRKKTATAQAEIIVFQAEILKIEKNIHSNKKRFKASTLERYQTEIDEFNSKIESNQKSIGSLSYILDGASQLILSIEEEMSKICQCMESFILATIAENGELGTETELNVSINYLQEHLVEVGNDFLRLG